MPTYKINYSGGKPRVINVNKLPNKTSLQSLDRVYLGQPFVNVVSKFQDTRGLDTIYLGQPFYGHTDAYSIIHSPNHRDVTDWLYNIGLNGGSASTSTIAALNIFCNSIESAGLRNKFYRLNLFCGNNLASCLVPLYRGPSPLSTQFGNTIDTNFNFVSADYNETGASAGLQGNGTGSPTFLGTKYLDTGLQPATIGLYSGHLATFVHNVNTTTSQQHTWMGIRDNTNPGQRWWMDYRTTYVFGDYSGSTSSSFTPQNGNGLYVVNRQTLNLLQFFYGSSQLGSNITTNIASSAVTRARNFFIFALNTDGLAGSHSGFRQSMYSIGLGMTPQQVQSFNTILQTFQTALNRNV
jgi:hypothetical protein